jgi:tetratricopeptide (TPR) repeat protein
MTEIDYLKKQVSIILNLYNSKRYEDVITKCNIFIKKYPEQIIFYNAASLSLSAIGKNDEALKILNKALLQQPNDINVLNNLGLVSFNLSKNKQAREYFEKAISLNNQFIDAMVNLSNLSIKEGKIEEAKKNLDRALELSTSQDKDEIINLGLGHYYQQTGNFEESIKYFEIVKKINPSNSIADREISVLHKYEKNDDPHLIEIETKLTQTKDIESVKRLSFAAGKAHEDLKNYDISFKYLKKANQIADEQTNYNLGDDKKLFANIKKLFTDFKKKPPIKSKKKIIFIIGMPRSGTTLAEQIISSHKDVYGAGELSFLSDGIYKFILNNNEFINQSINEISHKKVFEIREYYIEQIKVFSHNQKYITDKAPLNFRWIGLIKILFPDSKIIHCQRDPLDICFSNYKNSFAASSLSFSYNLENLGNFFNLYKDLMKFWDVNFSDDIYNLNYEELINNQELETKKLLKYCELEWDESCMRPHKNKKIVFTASLSQVRSPVYKSSIKKWENYSKQLKDLKKIIL